MREFEFAGWGTMAYLEVTPAERDAADAKWSEHERKVGSSLVEQEVSAEADRLACAGRYRSDEHLVRDCSRWSRGRGEPVLRVPAGRWRRWGLVSTRLLDLDAHPACRARACSRAEPTASGAQEATADERAFLQLTDLASHLRPLAVLLATDHG